MNSILVVFVLRSFHFAGKLNFFLQFFYDYQHSHETSGAEKKTNLYRMFPVVPGSVLNTNLYSLTQSLQPSCEVGTFIFLF